MQYSQLPDSTVDTDLAVNNSYTPPLARYAYPDRIVEPPLVPPQYGTPVRDNGTVHLNGFTISAELMHSYVLKKTVHFFALFDTFFALMNTMFYTPYALLFFLGGIFGISGTTKST